MSDFLVGLQITGWGMGLVFLTLLMVMLAIALLNWFFKDKGAAQYEKSSQPAEAIASKARANGTTSSDEAAAVALAIVLARRRSGGVAHDGRERKAETVNVLTIDPGPGVWSGYGRVKATR